MPHKEQLSEVVQLEVSDEDGQSFAEQNNMKFFSASALSGANIEEAFKHLANEMHIKVQ